MPSHNFPPLLPGLDVFLHGADYNPDQWLHEPEVIDEDFRLLPVAGMNSWSVGIFAWAALEPEPGVYRFEWLQDILGGFRG